jgi:hypothetical protein
MRHSIITLFVLSTILALANAIKFDLLAVTSDRSREGTKCLTQYVAKGTMVLATVNVGEGYNQRVELEVSLKNLFLQVNTYSLFQMNAKLDY